MWGTGRDGAHTRRAGRRDGGDGLLCTPPIFLADLLRHRRFGRAFAEAMAWARLRADAQLAEFHGIPLHNPFIDSRVIDVSLSVPLDQRPGPADYKPILRESVRDLLPTVLAARTTKGDATADRYHGLRANLDHLLRTDLISPRGLLGQRCLRRTDLRHRLTRFRGLRPTAQPRSSGVFQQVTDPIRSSVNVHDPERLRPQMRP
ncbi:MAG: asparagine synthase-related protein [Pseudonocardiaceae bacterium]